MEAKGGKPMIPGMAEKFKQIIAKTKGVQP